MASSMVKDQLSEADVQLQFKEKQAEKTQPKVSKKGREPISWLRDSVASKGKEMPVFS